MSDDDDKDPEKLVEAANEVLANLTAREAKVLREKLGINVSSEHALEEVAAQFDVMRERIQQIEEKALKKLARKNSMHYPNVRFVNYLAIRSID